MVTDTIMHFKLTLRKGNTQEALAMFSNGLPINGHKDGFVDRTPIMIAMAEKNTEVFYWLINQDGIDLEKADEYGNTALLYAVDQVSDSLADEFCLALIQKGANIVAENNEDFSVFLLAAQNGRTAIVKTLLDSGIDFSSHLSSALGYAANGVESHTLAKPELINLLIKHGADINTQDISGRTPLMNAIQNESFDVVTCLIQNKADYKIKSNEGLTALDYAKQFDNPSIIALLETYQTSCHEFLSLAEQIESTQPNHQGLNF